MITQQNAAALFIHRIDANQWSGAPYRDRVYALIDKGLGGIGVFAGSVEQTALAIEELQSRAGGRLLVGGDFECGLAMRLHDGVAMPRAMALGRCDIQRTYDTAAMVAEEAKAIGIHWNWAPVCDINSSPRNPIINTRAFGEDPDHVARHAEAWVAGTQNSGVAACAKHVPGHGDTEVDSHVGLPRLTIEANTARTREFVPFQSAIRGRVASVMVGHLLVPFLDDALPASLSGNVVQNLIRAEWGYDGFVVTDALDMGAITSNWSSAEACVSCINAGVDGVLMPHSTEEGIAAVAQAIHQGEISGETLANAERRWGAMREYIPRRSRKQTAKINTEAHALYALETASLALHQIGRSDLVPLTRYGHAVMFAVVDETDIEMATTFFRYVAQSGELNVDFGFIDGTMSEDDLSAMVQDISDAQVVYFVLFGRAVANRGHIPGHEHLPSIFRALAHGRPSVVVACGSPYGITDLPADAYVLTYSDTQPSIAAAALLCSGRSGS